MKIAVITAMPEEFRAIITCFGSAGVAPVGALSPARFQTGEHQFVVMESGMGFDNAARAAAALIRDERPDLLISAGFCGGLDPEMQAGDVVVAQRIVIADGERCEEVPVILSPIGQNFVALQVAGGRGIVAGAFISTGKITSKRELNTLLSGRYLNPVVEMESGAIAIIAAENGIPLLAIRAVSDPVDEELGFSLDELCDADMRRILIYKVLLTMLSKPRIIPQFVRLAFSSRRAAEGLTATLSRLFASL